MNKTIAVVVAVVVVLGAAYYLSVGIPTTTMPVTTEQGAQETRDPMMAGMWKSQTDEKFTREIKVDGVMIDRYEGDVSAGINGEWSVVDPAKEIALADRAGALAATTVIKIVWEGGVETTYFAVNKLDEKSMTITDLSGRGGVTIFSKT